jgi:hypothetical protein
MDVVDVIVAFPAMLLLGDLFAVHRDGNHSALRTGDKVSAEILFQDDPVISGLFNLENMADG